MFRPRPKPRHRKPVSRITLMGAVVVLLLESF